ncbi:plancitoxin-1 [Microplitis demolitor]|uniref:plancitoxin-1 n=1 Tax=Microplitis demolitor TaxID=69319 RepID=UPI0004CD0F1D|nr:plancitoxin-1 [Microplitis demolitor]
MYLIYILLLIIYTTGVINSGKSNLQCKDEAGNDVDWFVLYKIPRLTESNNRLIKKGVGYVYITSDTVSEGWQLSEKDIGATDSIPGQTLSTLYNDDEASEILWIMYNDQGPNSTYNSKYGHAKGVLMTDDTRGFWLIHSVPNYPLKPRTGTDNKPSKARENEEVSNFNSSYYYYVNLNMVPDGEYAYPRSGRFYGQSFLCISMESSQMNTVGQQLIHNQIITYRYNLPESLAAEFPSLVNASQNIRPKNRPFSHKEEILSSGGQEFISFAKTSKWRKDLYDDFVAPELNTDLLAETWLNGRGKLPSECNGSKVLNVQSITLNSANVNFRNSRDHSKWAVAQNNRKNRNWVCVGDINRESPQFNRGGGTVCVNLPELWTNYRDSVNDVEPCPRKKYFLRDSMDE